MNKKEHIQHWLGQISEDMDVVMILFESKHYGHSLFWAHLVLEKSLKALWIQNNNEHTPPLIHNLLKLSKLSFFVPNEEQILFMQIMNDYNILGRYVDYMRKIEFTTNEETAAQLLDQYKKLVECIQKQIH